MAVCQFGRTTGGGGASRSCGHGRHVLAVVGSAAHQSIGGDDVAVPIAVLGGTCADHATEVTAKRLLRAKPGLLGHPLQRPVGGFQQFVRARRALADQLVDR